MKLSNLGRSGLLVSDLCLGTMIFGEESSRGTSPDDAEKIIHRYIDAGGNYIDTANVYAGGRSEEIVGQAIKNIRQNLVIATKVRFPLAEGPNNQGLSRTHIISAAEASLQRLDTDYIDLYYMHLWDPITPIEESLRAMEDLVKSGKVRYIGVSNFKAWQLMKTLAVSDTNSWNRIVAGQYQYSLVKRDIEYEFIDLCISEGVGIHPWGPLGGGILSGKYNPKKKPETAEEGRMGVTPDGYEESWQRRNTQRNWAILDVVDEIAKVRNATQPQIALAWLRGQKAVTSTIIGVRTLAQLEDNLGAAEINLTEDEMEKLNQVSELPELYPYRMVKKQSEIRLSAILGNPPPPLPL
jgi:aryl-alcohol dehydrogenase-like predicted oxidoreductase